MSNAQANAKASEEANKDKTEAAKTISKKSKGAKKVDSLVEAIQEHGAAMLSLGLTRPR